MQHLKAWRRVTGLTLEQVAEALGTSHTTVLRWEAGRHRVPEATTRELARLFGASEAELCVHPDTRGLAARLERARTLLGAMADEDADAWLLVGERLARRLVATDG